jgi:quercetin dioxygenase-like cupin family protein
VKRIIENQMLVEKNIHIEDETMPNGENRFRIKLEDGAGVNITTTKDSTGWQNAHFHKSSKELYIVQKGKILFATKHNNDVMYKTYEKGDYVIIEPMIEHNVYMYPNTMTIVTKFGDIKENDWYSADELDKITKEYIVK